MDNDHSMCECHDCTQYRASCDTSKYQLQTPLASQTTAGLSCAICGSYSFPHTHGQSSAVSGDTFGWPPK